MKTKDIQDDPIYKYIQDLKREWDNVKKVRTKVFTSWDGEEIEVKSYFNPMSGEYTPLEESAFKGFVIRKLQTTIDRVWGS